MLVRELVGGEVFSCGLETTVVDAARIMVANGAGSLAVMADDELVGIITERDLIEYVADPSRGPNTRVDQLMTPDPDALEPDVELSAAADWMLAAGYRHLPVVDGTRLIGIISIKDVLWAMTEGRDAR